MNFIGMVRQEENSVELSMRALRRIVAAAHGHDEPIAAVARSTSGNCLRTGGARFETSLGTESNADRSITVAWLKWRWRPWTAAWGWLM